MEVVETVPQLRALISRIQRPLGLVPTMGYLHDGHMSLVRKARTENETVVASIFVNPTQFAPTEDLATYPRDMERDLGMLRSEGVDIVFNPTREAMYASDFNSWVEVLGVTSPLEGAVRPGHFRGVATVVAKLFNIVQPDRAYFGQKDAQQVVVIKKMVADLNFPVDIVVGPTVREPDGLAMSSRNTYLAPDERYSALVLSKALAEAQLMYRNGESDAEKMRQAMLAVIAGEPLAKADYVSVANGSTLEELQTIDRGNKTLVSMAVRIGRTRLIDNVVLG